MLTRIAQMVSVVLTGLLAGLFAGRWFGAPASRQYEGPVFTEVQQRVDATVGAWAPGLIMGAIVALAVTLLLVRRPFGTRFLLTAGALVLVVALTVSTQIVNVPINEEINSWVVSSPPADWAEFRDRWEAYHTLRTVFAVLALVLIAASVTLTRDPRLVHQPVGAAAR
ncbi:DUF1772 domain-containing protein [Actinoplanes utahensis]|uniref:DUF1772 domain-containing protein n=1 Tax=Actinoplanes utahensis TaxID=1869 RepID=UPI0006908029|nr:DUF1772 domain-containing protein [Actinoplanes utahensis]GIF27023.1 hypothetical protein Aut01nite_00090 [Actinoplanes utahensis]